MDSSHAGDYRVIVSNSVKPVSSEVARLEVTVANTPPAISSINALNTNENVPTESIVFSVSDEEDAAEQLRVTASSSNVALVPVSNIDLSGTGRNRTVEVRPAANQSGTVTIRLTVEDTEGSGNSSSFTLTVLPRKVFEIIATASSGGRIIPSGTSAKNQGESLRFSATPEAGYIQDRWFLDNAEVQVGGASYQLSNIQENHSMRVTFRTSGGGEPAGELQFNNRILGKVDARVIFADGNGVGAGWTAQLYGGPEGTASSELSPLFPTTSFRTTSTAAMGYVNPVGVLVPGVGRARPASLILRVYDGSSYETSNVRGESNPITIALGGGNQPPAALIGLNGFTIDRGASPLPPPPTEGGLVHFNNRIIGTVDARVTSANGTGLGVGWTAQLYGAAAGTPVSALIPLYPTTSFRTTSSAAMGYVNSVDVTVSGVDSGKRAILVMRAFNGASYETSTERGESAPITVVVGGNILLPASLTGLGGFRVQRPTLSPVITSHPVSQSVVEGVNVVFSVTATGTAPLNYRWLFNGMAIQAATSQILSIDNVRSYRSGAYSVSVSSSNGSVESNDATLTVLSATGNVKGDFNGDGYSDILFQDNGGTLVLWLMNRANFQSAAFLMPSNVGDLNYRIVGSGDFNGDSNEDLLFQHADGRLVVWFMNGAIQTGSSSLSPNSTGDGNWRAEQLGDFDLDGKTDIVFQHTDGTLAVWFMDGTKLKSTALFTPSSPGDAGWRVVGVGDLNQDQNADLAFQHTDGRLAVWYLKGVVLTAGALTSPASTGNSQWRVVGLHDIDGDGQPDVLFQHSGDGTLAVWYMNGTSLREVQLLNPSSPGGSWKVVGP